MVSSFAARAVGTNTATLVSQCSKERPQKVEWVGGGAGVHVLQENYFVVLVVKKCVGVCVGSVCCVW